MSSQFAEWVEIAEKTGGHMDFSIYDILQDWREDRAQRDAERDDLIGVCESMLEAICAGAEPWMLAEVEEKCRVYVRKGRDLLI